MLRQRRSLGGGSRRWVAVVSGGRWQSLVVGGSHYEAHNIETHLKTSNSMPIQLNLIELEIL